MCPAIRKAAPQPCTNGSRGLPDGRLKAHPMQVIAEALTGAAQTPLALRVHVAAAAGLRCAVLAYGPPQPPSGALWLHEIKHDGSAVT